jgi:[protein-PII] uridylyltransferase
VTVPSLAAARAALVADRSLQGVEFTRALAVAADAWLVSLFTQALDGWNEDGIALLATGGYGRGELAPHSDLDLLLVHRERREAPSVADRLWYPIWDEGIKLGHAVRTLNEAGDVQPSDLDTATSLLDVRLVAGDPTLLERLQRSVDRRWQGNADRFLASLRRRRDEDRTHFGEVAFLLEPDIKNGEGGLRDLHVARWIDRIMPCIDPTDRRSLDEAERMLTALRVELHRTSPRPTEVLTLEMQDVIAPRLGYEDADALVGHLAYTARRVSLFTDDVLFRTERAKRRLLARRARPEPLGDGLVMVDRVVQIDGDVDDDPWLALRAADAAASRHVGLSLQALRRLEAQTVRPPEPWPDEARELFVRLLCNGHPAIRVIESLDLFGVWTRFLPEWEPNRNRPQRNAYHRFTVDRHLLEAAAEAARLADRADRPDLLVVGALLHDIGKGYPGDHTESGEELVEVIGARMGFSHTDVGTLRGLIRHHLLLPDVATRRDLDDPATIDSVASKLPSAEFTRLLALMTEADSIATGPAAWGTWKAALVERLTTKVESALSGRIIDTAYLRTFPTANQRELMATGGLHVLGDGNVLTVVAPDRPGLFARIAGVLTLRGLAVLQADAYSTDSPVHPPTGGDATDGPMALSAFTVVVHPDSDPIDWPACLAQVRAAIDGRVAIEARVAERSRVYRARSALTAHPVPTSIRFERDLTPNTTIIDVRTADRVGVLYHVTKAIASLDLDIRYAKVQTMVHEVVDSFYVRTRHGTALDEQLEQEVELAIRHALDAAAWMDTASGPARSPAHR